MTHNPAPRELRDYFSETSEHADVRPGSPLVNEYFDWRGDQPPRCPWGVDHPGTYLGLVEKIPYLKSLGVTAVELMPVQEFNQNSGFRFELASVPLTRIAEDPTVRDVKIFAAGGTK